MNLGPNIIKATCISRPNRFTVIAHSNRAVLTCYLANTGRLTELLKPNADLALRSTDVPGRKTSYDVVAVRYGKELVSVDTRVPNKLVNQALSEGELLEFKSYDTIKREIEFGRSRFDYLLSSQGGSCLLEIKSCNLVEDGVALFPDAPTARGAKHLSDLARAKRQRYRACVMFVIQRSDASSFMVNERNDPNFCKAFKRAIRRGVEVYARSCKFKGFDLSLDRSIPIIT